MVRPKAPPSQFYSRDFLIAHVKDILRFYESRCRDEAGGYFQSFYDNGDRFDEGFKQLVSSTRMVINFALAGKLLDSAELLELARHGLEYVEKVHWCEDTSAYAYTIKDGAPEDMTQQSYAHAFVLYMHAACLLAGLHKDGTEVAKAFKLLEDRFWLPEHQAYADTLGPDGALNDYRGQNSNMHICEALIAAHEATGEDVYIQRAKTLAETFTQRLAKLAEGLVWEHYTLDWAIAWDYNKDDPNNLYRPWGFQPGHQIEWAKNLLNICRFAPEPWMQERAEELFNRAWRSAWDAEYGGLVYGFGPEGKWCDTDKYFWVQAESIATSAQLYQVTGKQRYLECYRALWQYSWDHLVDHEHGAWWRILNRENSKYSNEKSGAGSKCDYHSLVSCLEALRGLR